MLRRVLSRAPLPESAHVYGKHKLPLKVKDLARKEGLAVSFTTTAASIKASHLPMGFKGKVGEVELVPEAKSRQLVAGMKGTAPPETAKVTAASTTTTTTTVYDYRRAVNSAVAKAKKLGATVLTVRPPCLGEVLSVPDIFHDARQLTEAEIVEKTACFAVTAAYEYNRLKSSSPASRGDGKPRSGRGGRKTAAAASTEVKAPMKFIVDSNLTNAVAAGSVIGSCVNDSRNLGNLREDEGTPEFYVEWAKKFMLPQGIKLRAVLRGKEIEKKGMNLLYSVGKGSVHEPYVLVLEYVGNHRSAHSTALVGKGVTFDCGGLNIKPYGSMETMHTDMMGAATALSTLKAVAQLQLPINVVAAVGFVENAISAEAFHPSTILTSLKGTTVEILNTDAEGRLVLADLLTYVQDYAKLSKKPHTIIDLATLTGAIIVSLGSRRAGLFSNNGDLTNSLMLAGTTAGEELWPMPVAEEHRQLLKGGIADIINCAPGRQGGSCTAAAFLEHFVSPGTNWAHMDIAGTSDNGDKPKAGEPAGVSGYGVQLLVDYLRSAKTQPGAAAAAAGKAR